MEVLNRLRKKDGEPQKPQRDLMTEYYGYIKNKILENVKLGNFTSFDGEHTLTESLEDWRLNNRGLHIVFSFMKQLLLEVGYSPVEGESTEKSEFRERILFIVRSQLKELREFENAFRELSDPNYFEKYKINSLTTQNLQQTDDPDAIFRPPAAPDESPRSPDETQEHKAVNPE